MCDQASLIFTVYLNVSYERSYEKCMIVVYRVFLKGWNSPTPSKSLIFWTFPNVLGFFSHSIWAIFILVLLRHIIEKKV